jgi:hypothetical protein
MSLKFVTGHVILIALASPCKRFSGFVSCSRAWVAGSSEFSNEMPCFSAVLVTRACTFLSADKT